MEQCFLINIAVALALITQLEPQLTNREVQILKLIADGLTNKQVAKKLKLSVKTVDAHRANIRTMLRIHDFASLIKYAIRTGLTSVEG